MLSFFGRNPVSEALDKLVKSTELTLFVGAGASMEVGLPSWADLVEKLFLDAIRKQKWGNDEAHLLEVVHRKGLLQAAEIVEAMMGSNDLSRHIKRHLYPDSNPSLAVPGPLANGVALLQATWHGSMRIVTTNYDLLLETALEGLPSDAKNWSRVKSYVSSQDAQPDCVSVTHLHGVIAKETRGDVVLTEGDFNRMQFRQSWQEKLMVKRLESSAVLFVGTSLTDANLIRYLYRANSGHPRYALMLHRQISGRTNDEREVDRRRRDREEALDSRRWKHLGIEPIFTDFYAEIAQFIHELSAKQSGEYQSLPNRLHTHLQSAKQKGVLYTGNADDYLNIQTVLNSELRKIEMQVKLLMDSFSKGIRSEPLAVALWSVYPPARKGPRNGNERLVVLATSDRIMTSPESVAPIELSEASWVGVRAVTHGTARRDLSDTYATRWKYVIGYPVYGENPRIPLGAVTISCMSEQAVQKFESLNGQQRALLGEPLTSRAAVLLTANIKNSA